MTVGGDLVAVRLSCCASALEAQNKDVNYQRQKQIDTILVVHLTQRLIR